MRLGHCSEVRGLDQVLGEVFKHYPNTDLKSLRQKAVEKLHELEAAQHRVNQRRRFSHRGEVSQGEVNHRNKVARAARALLTLLAETPAMGPDSPELDGLRIYLQKDQGVGPQARVRFLRSRYSLRRKCFEPTEAADYLEALDQATDELLEHGRCWEAAQIMAERVKAHPTSAGRLRYGGLLQRLGRVSEAADQYSRVGAEHPSKHYNLAVVEWLQGRPEQALEHVCRGFVRDVDFERTRQGEGRYWELFGDLWPTDGKRFFVKVGTELLVRWRIRRSREVGVRLRRLLPRLSLKWFLPKVLGPA